MRCLRGCKLNTSPVNAPLPALINSPVKIKKHLYNDNPIIYNSLKIWKQVTTTLKTPKVYLDSPICCNHAFKPALDDVVFSNWREKGIITLRNVYIEGHLASFQQLQWAFQLPASHFSSFPTVETLCEDSCSTI